MNALHNGHIGVHSFLSGGERNLHLMAYHPWAEYISNAVHVNGPGIQAVVQTCPFPAGTLNALLQTVVSLDIFMHCNYPFPTGTPTSGVPFQNALQTSASQFSEAASAIKTYLPGTPFYAIIQAHQASGTFNYRAPSLEEILCQINLAMAYGAKGIVYYLYARTIDGQEGLLDVNRNPTSRYTSVQSIHNNYQALNQKLVEIGANFLPLSWQAGFSIHQNTDEPLNSIYKLHDVTAKIPGGATDAENETYVEAGVLQNGSTNHYMVVNRRCTTSETREVSVVFQCTANKTYRITDVYTGGATTYYVGAGSTTFPYTLILGPGQGRLLKLEDLGNFSGTWSGNVTANSAWVGTITVNTEVTVNSGISLTIVAGSNLQFVSAKKLIINGSLQTLGTSPQPVTFDRSGASGTWNGINFGITGSGSVNYATIDHATKGVKIDITNNVTLDHCVIKNFTEQGVYLNASSATVQYCTIKDAPTASYGIWSSGNNANPTIANNVISDMPIGITRNGSPGLAAIRNNTIYNCTNAGIMPNNSQPEIYNNVFYACANGIRLQTGSSSNIHDNDLYNNQTGVFMEQSQPGNLKWKNFGYVCGSGAYYNTSYGMLINYLAAGNSFMALKWNDFYDGNTAYDILNNTATTLAPTGQYWNHQIVSGQVSVSSPQGSRNADAGPCGSMGKESAAGEIITQNPTGFNLAQNFPNPFNPTTIIRFRLPERALVSLAIYDLNGRLVRQLFSQRLFENGWGEGSWDGKNEQGLQVVSGVYVYRLQAQALESNASFAQSRRLVLMQ